MPRSARERGIRGGAADGVDDLQQQPGAVLQAAAVLVLARFDSGERNWCSR
jgi:hypothetical protein